MLIFLYTSLSSFLTPLYTLRSVFLPTNCFRSPSVQILLSKLFFFLRTSVDSFWTSLPLIMSSTKSWSDILMALMRSVSMIQSVTAPVVDSYAPETFFEMLSDALPTAFDIGLKILSILSPKAPVISVRSLSFSPAAFFAATSCAIATFALLSSMFSNCAKRVVTLASVSPRRRALALKTSITAAPVLFACAFAFISSMPVEANIAPIPP